MSRGNSRKLTRGPSSNSLLPRGPGQGLNPEALFSVAAMATAPVGGTVIEDEESESDSGRDSYRSGFKSTRIIIQPCFIYFIAELFLGTHQSSSEFLGVP